MDPDAVEVSASTTSDGVANNLGAAESGWIDKVRSRKATERSHCSITKKGKRERTLEINGLY